MQRNLPGAACGGPVVLRPVRVTPCLTCFYVCFVYIMHLFHDEDDDVIGLFTHLHV